MTDIPELQEVLEFPGHILTSIVCYDSGFCLQSHLLQSSLNNYLHIICCHICSHFMMKDGAGKSIQNSHEKVIGAENIQV